jgi:hypothetical protein
MKLKEKISLCATGLLLAMSISACQNSSPSSSSPVQTPISGPPANVYQLPSDAPACLQGHSFHDHDDMCRQIRDGSGFNGCAQDRYSYFNHACQNMHWQDR